MKIAVAQLNQVVGDFKGNLENIRKAFEQACASGADLLMTPELSICGYAAHDLMIRPEMPIRNDRAVESLLEVTRGKKTALIVGHVAKNTSSKGHSSFNRVSVLKDGEVIFKQDKTLLPTYDVFDEARYFEPSKSIQLFEFGGRRIALAICEDLWAMDPRMERNLYGRDPVDEYLNQRADLVLGIAASPYELAKRHAREEVHGKVARKTGTPLVYVNQVGATDGILFDGGAFALDANGVRVGRLPLFSEAFGVVEVGGNRVHMIEPGPDGREDQLLENYEVLTRGLMTGIRCYFHGSGFKKAIVGLSGGIDSAVTAVLVAQALGPENVLGIGMPSPYSSGHSLGDAEALAKNLGIRFEVHPIKFSFSTMKREFSQARGGDLREIALENLQSRLRGITLMTLSNHDGALVVNTGNKSELATGYCTLYGDLIGAVSPLGDLYKTQVYELARFLNANYGDKIPPNSLEKAPSAELRPDQVDQDSLPPYEQLDAMLADYVENKVPLVELEKRYGQWVHEICLKLEQNEYKRSQAPLVFKVSSRAFGVGRRIPISKVWDQ